MLPISCIVTVCQRFCQGVESHWPSKIRSLLGIPIVKSPEQRLCLVFFVLKCDTWFYFIFWYTVSKIFPLLLEGICGLRGIFECIFSQSYWQHNISKIIQECTVPIHDKIFSYECDEGLPCYQSPGSCNKGLENCTFLLLHDNDLYAD